MKKILLSLAAVFSLVFFFNSCTNDENISNNGYSEEENAKIETLMNLFDSYGWELDTTVSVEQRNKELLEMDYEKTKSFLEYMKNGIEFDNFEPVPQDKNNEQESLNETKAARAYMTFPIYEYTAAEFCDRIWEYDFREFGTILKCGFADYVDGFGYCYRPEVRALFKCF